jgi:phage repressor protein C with HTH and peptisase S24 domain
MSRQPHSRLAERLRQRLQETGRNATELSLSIGRGKDYVNDLFKGKKDSFKSDVLVAIARELDVTVPWLQGDDDAPKEPSAGQPPLPGRTLPVYGTAAGALDGALHMTTDVIEWIPCPAGLAGARDAYALYVVGDSMVPRFRHGEIIFVAPHRPPVPGDDVVIQVRHSESGATQSWVKEFVRLNGDEVVVRQHNPASEKRFARGDVVEMHRVMRINELVGL